MPYPFLDVIPLDEYNILYLSPIVYFLTYSNDISRIIWGFEKSGDLSPYFKIAYAILKKKEGHLFLTNLSLCGILII